MQNKKSEYFSVWLQKYRVPGELENMSLRILKLHRYMALHREFFLFVPRGSLIGQ